MCIRDSPTAEVLKEAELDPGTAARLNGIKEAIANGFKIKILSTCDAVWGLWEELGAEIVREPSPALPDQKFSRAVDIK